MPTKLLPHQEEAKNKLQRQHGLLLNWRTGSGKTIGAIAAADVAGNPVEVVVPASLRENFKKELRAYKHKVPFKVESYEKFVRDTPDLSGKTLVFDESHRLRTSDTQRSQRAQHVSDKAKKVLLLTGTPIQDAPHEIAPLINIAAGKHVLPTSEKEFNKKYVGHYKWDPGLLKYLGFKAVDKKFGKNLSDFHSKVKPFVSTYKGTNDPNMPVVKNVTVHAEMSPTQTEVYRVLEKRLPKSMRIAIQEQLPADKKDIGKLNAFLSATRQISNTSEKFYRTDKKVYSPKLLNTAKIIRDTPGKALIYSNYLEAGVNPMSELLTAINVPHAQFTGKLKDRERKELVSNYNKGKLRALIVSSSGGEGLDLKATRQVHILEPHWNEAKIEQVIGRSIRHGSHKTLKPKDREVTVYRYQSLLPKEERGLIFKKKVRPVSVDQYIENLATKKKVLNQEFLNQL
jgi:SNF2 family DNA or RNA helicase